MVDADNTAIYVIFRHYIKHTAPYVQIGLIEAAVVMCERIRPRT